MTGVDPLAEAKRLLTADPARAAALAEAALRHVPSDATTLLLATARRRAGDVEGALAVAAALAARLPGAWGAQFEHGMALSATGRSEAAVAALERALAANPQANLALHARADLLMLRGTAHDRPAILLLGHAPAVAAAASYFAGTEPAASLVARFGLDPNDVAAACLLAEIGAARGLHEAVASLLTDTLRRASGHQPARFRLAEALHRATDDAAALAAAEPLPEVAPVLALRASILMALGRADEAAAALARAATLAPGAAQVAIAHGHALRAIGARDTAVAAYRAAIPAAEAYWSIADLKTDALTAADIAAMEEQLTRPDLPSIDHSHLHFALGNALRGSEDDERAFRHLLAANRVRCALEPFDRTAHEDFIERTIATCDAPFFAARAGSGDPAPDPIFVVGMPRAGSSLVEQILGSHSAVESAGELPDLTALARSLAAGRPYPEALALLTPADLAAAGARYLGRTWLRRHTPAPRFVDKFPGNVLHLPLIHLALPHARVIDVRRHPLDCCVSLFAQSFARGQAYSYNLADLGAVYAAYVRLTAHIDAVLPGRVLCVSYEALVDDLEGETRRMLDHCGLAFEPACLRFFERAGAVRTASSEQVRRPLHRGGIGRWRRFAPWLGPLVDALEAGGVKP